MASYRPSLPFSVPMVVLTPTVTKVAGVSKTVIPAIKDGFTIYGTFRTFGGTERQIDNLYSIEDTAEIETWFRPDITSGSIIALADTVTQSNPNGTQYRVIDEPENINRRNQFMKFKVQREKGNV